MYTDDFLDELEEALEMVERSASDAQQSINNLRVMLQNHEIARENLTKLTKTGKMEDE